MSALFKCRFWPRLIFLISVFRGSQQVSEVCNRSKSSSCTYLRLSWQTRVSSSVRSYYYLTTIRFRFDCNLFFVVCFLDSALKRLMHFHSPPHVLVPFIYPTIRGITTPCALCALLLMMHWWFNRRLKIIKQFLKLTALLHYCLVFPLFLVLSCSAKVCEEKLRYAAYNCVAIDTDMSPWEEWSPYCFTDRCTRHNSVESRYLANFSPYPHNCQITNSCI